RGAGHCRGRAVRPCRARHAARPRRRRLCRADPAPAGGAGGIVGSPDSVQVFLASRNPKKLGEMRRILSMHLAGVSVLGLDDVAAYDEPVEDQPTFAGNALVKARSGLTATGLPTVADDSG